MVAREIAGGLGPTSNTFRKDEIPRSRAAETRPKEMLTMPCSFLDPAHPGRPPRKVQDAGQPRVHPVDPPLPRPVLRRRPLRRRRPSQGCARDDGPSYLFGTRPFGRQWRREGQDEFGRGWFAAWLVDGGGEHGEDPPVDGRVERGEGARCGARDGARLLLCQGASLSPCGRRFLSAGADPRPRTNPSCLFQLRDIEVIVQEKLSDAATLEPEKVTLLKVQEILYSTEVRP